MPIVLKRSLHYDIYCLYTENPWIVFTNDNQAKEMCKRKESMTPLWKWLRNIKKQPSNIIPAGYGTIHILYCPLGVACVLLLYQKLPKIALRSPFTFKDFPFIYSQFPSLKNHQKRGQIGEESRLANTITVAIGVATWP